jgi:hypothetical protein
MSSKWWQCNCCACSPDLTAGGLGPDLVLGGSIDLGRLHLGTMYEGCKLCAVYIVRLRFATEAAARHYVGESNYSLIGGQWLTDEWMPILTPATQRDLSPS